MMSFTGLRTLLGGTIPWSGVLVFNYHRIGDGRASLYDRGLWSASADSFREQLRFCKAHLDMIMPEDLPRVIESGRGRYGMITFDDGYRDNYEAAYPILKDEGVRATFFVSTGFMDKPCVPWWDEIAWMVRTSKRDRIVLSPWLTEPVALDRSDRETAVRQILRALKTLPTASTGKFLDALAEASGSGRCVAGEGQNVWMTWDMLREMKAGGMVIGGHSVTHPVLARSSPEQQRDEILACGKRLAEELHGPMYCFSYPVGGGNASDSVTRECLREAGVRYAFSYYGGFRRFKDWDDYDIRRVPVETCVTKDWFRSIVSLPHIFA